MNLIYSMQQCSIILSALLGPANPPETDELFEERVMVCTLIMDEAKRQSVPADLALAVAWQESDMTEAGTNPWGCTGPMQIKIKYWCPNADGEWSATRADGVLPGCDVYERGMFALKYYLKRFRTTESALCAYGWGNCDDEGREKYVKQTLRYRSVIKRVLITFDRYQAER
ncbi:MAG: transglycosylase SLT domain-containing protein [Chlamydiota bacterium]|nr:transglycosylase SLT domain-containing protein [Chlamydiota bacterium]